MDTFSNMEQPTKSLHSASQHEAGDMTAHNGGGGSSLVENDLYEDAHRSDNGTVSRLPSVGIGMGAGGLVSAGMVSTNMMVYVNSETVPQPLSYEHPCLELSNSSRSVIVQSKTLAPSIHQRQRDGNYSTTIDYSYCFVPSTITTPHTELPFNIQQSCAPCYLSTFQAIHKLTHNNGILSFNHQAESSFNTLLPHRQCDSDFRAPESNYKSAPHCPSPTPSYQTFIQREDMPWPSTTNQTRSSNLGDLTGEDYPGSFSSTPQGELPHLPYQDFPAYAPTMPHTEPADLGNEDYIEAQVSTPNTSGHWKASVNPEVGEEGVTPYLHQREFEKAEDVLDENNDEVDTELMFNNFQEAVSWRSRTRSTNPLSAADPTIPRTMQQRKAAVKLVFKAYKSTAIATDNPGMLKAFQEEKHDNRQVETICWSIVEGCIDRCIRGPLLNAYEPEKAKNNPSIKTFAERLDAMVTSLSRQKTICKHLLDAPYLNRFIDDPVGSRQRVESNRKLNKKKGGVMDLGKKALGLAGKIGKAHGNKSSDAVSDDEADEYQSESQEVTGESSGISSPFKTPNQPMRQGKGSTDRVSKNANQLYSAEQNGYDTPTPSRRRRRAGTTNPQTPLRRQTAQYSPSQQYASAEEMSPNVGLGITIPSMGMTPSSYIDPNLHMYASQYNASPFNPSRTQYGGEQNFAPMMAYDNAAIAVTLPISSHRYKTDLGIQNAYSTHESYYGAYAAESTATQQQPLFENSPQANPVPTLGGPPNPITTTRGKDSDEEYVPEPGRKRRRQK
jgi:hypothetical protein